VDFDKKRHEAALPVLAAFRENIMKTTRTAAQLEFLTDATLLRYLRARESNLVAAEKVRYIISHLISSHHISLHRVVSHCITSRCITSHCIAPIASHRVASHRTASLISHIYSSLIFNHNLITAFLIII
jgi:hypothetical protein